MTILVLAIILCACGGSDRPTKPDNLIPKDKMSDILYDVFLLNSAKGINKKILENNGILPQDYVFKKYNIDSIQFAQSNDYYSYDIKTYETIIGRVKQKIEAEKIKNEAIILKEKKTKDSISEARNKVKSKDTLLKVHKLKSAEFKKSLRNSDIQK